MTEFEENPRQGVIVYLYRLRNSRQLRKFGQIQYISKKMKYVVLYMDQANVEGNIERLKKLKFVKHVEPSVRPFLRVEYSGSEDGQHYEMTEEDREKFKKTSIEEFKNINSAGISTISIFVETPVTSAFSNLASQNGEYHKNFQTSTADLATTIVKDIYNEIYLKIILMSEPKTEYNINHNGVLLGSDKIIFQMDEEILHGATLKVEYIISITTAFDMNNVKINDFYSSDFVFNSNEPLLTELKTNNDYGWKIENGTLVSNSGDGTIEGATEYRIKLVLSTLLTPERLPDLSKMGNYMTFSVHDITDNRVISVGETANIKALDFLILPPTGEDNLSTKDLLGLLRLSIFTLAAVIVIICINNYVKEHRYR